VAPGVSYCFFNPNFPHAVEEMFDFFCRPANLITFEPNAKFVDVMVKGPFRKWEHAHGFATIDGGTRVADHLEYEPPCGLLGLVATPALVARDLASIFAFRCKVLEELRRGRRCQ
jgi:ligand-binding SRPBCC domain-containing protein